MRSVIYKYPLTPAEWQTVPLGIGLHVGPDLSGTACLWVRHTTADLEHSDRPMTVQIVGTGHPLMDDMMGAYVGSCVDGQFMWHVFLVL